MATYRVTWFFQDGTNNIGWTENWWVTATDAAGALGSVSNYATVRKNLMMDTSQIVAIRACSIGPPRDSLYLGTGLPITGTIVTSTAPIAGVWDCLLCRRDISNDTLLGHMFMHIVPRIIFTGRVYNPAGGTSLGWPAAFIAFGVEVTSGLYLLKQGGASPGYRICTTFLGVRRTERRLGRPFDPLRGRRSVA